MFLIGLCRTYGAKKRILAIGILLSAIVLFLAANFIPQQLKQDYVQLQSAGNSYDVTGDGFVTVEDLDQYRLLFNSGALDGLDFNGDGVVDIYDQTLLAYNVVDIQRINFPIILKGS